MRSRRIEGRPDGLHSTIHHVGGSHDIGTSLRLGESQTAERLNRPVILHTASLIEQTIVAMIRVGIERHISDHGKMWAGGLHRTNRREKDIPRVMGMRGKRILLGTLNAGKDRHSEDPSPLQLPALLHERRHRVADHSRHRFDRLGIALSSTDKERLNQIGTAECGFPHQRAHAGGGAIAPHPAKKI